MQLQGESEFVLRQIAGVNLCVDTAANGGRFNFRNPSDSYANGNPSSGIIVGQNWPVVPEKGLHAEQCRDLVRFVQHAEIFTVGGETGQLPSITRQIAFFGVKRFQRRAGV